MFSVNGVYTLLDVVIVNPTQVDLMSWVAFSCGVATTIAIEAKNGFYYDRFLSNMFLPSIIKILRCLHQQTNKYFHQCTNMVWGAKGIGRPLLLVLHAFYKQKMSMTLEHA